MIWLSCHHQKPNISDVSNSNKEHGKALIDACDSVVLSGHMIDELESRVTGFKENQTFNSTTLSKYESQWYL